MEPEVGLRDPGESLPTQDILTPLCPGARAAQCQQSNALRPGHGGHTEGTLLCQLWPGPASFHSPVLAEEHRHLDAYIWGLEMV